jgi:hypothetical protein
MSRFIRGRRTILPIQPCSARRGVHGDGGVAEHGFGAGGGDAGEAGAVGEGIFEVPEVAVDLAVFDLVVGEGGLELGAPVDHVVAAIDEALVVEALEDEADGAREALVHGEALAGPVAGAAERLELADDGGAVVLLPVPDFRQEFFARERRESTPSAASLRETTCWVAMPAWSTPGSQSVLKPRMRRQRVRMSWIVPLRAWPMWRTPVTLGGGMTMVKAGGPLAGSAVK